MKRNPAGLLLFYRGYTSQGYSLKTNVAKDLISKIGCLGVIRCSDKKSYKSFDREGIVYEVVHRIVFIEDSKEKKYPSLIIGAQKIFSNDITCDFINKFSKSEQFNIGDIVRVNISGDNDNIIKILHYTDDLKDNEIFHHSFLIKKVSAISKLLKYRDYIKILQISESFKKHTKNECKLHFI